MISGLNFRHFPAVTSRPTASTSVARSGPYSSQLIASR